jgi:hypothetical protein
MSFRDIGQTFGSDVMIGQYSQILRDASIPAAFETSDQVAGFTESAPVTLVVNQRARIFLGQSIEGNHG